MMIEKIKRLLSDAAIYGVERYLNALLMTVLIPVYTRYLAPGDYGSLELVLTVFYFMNFLFVLGLDAALGRYLYDCATPAEERVLVSTNFLLRVGVSLAVAALLVPSAKSVSLFLGARDAGPLLALGMAALPFFAVIYTGMDYLRLRFRPGTYSLLTAGSALLAGLLSVYFVAVEKQGAFGIMLGQLIAYACFAAAAVFTLRDLLRPAFSRSIAIRLLSFGLPLVPAGVFYWVLQFSDRFFLARFASLSELGIFAIGVKLSMVLALLTSAFQLAWHPFALSIYKENGAREVYARVFTWFLAVVLFAAVVLTAFAREILALVTVPEYFAAHRVVGPLSLGAAFFGVYWVVCIGVTISQRTKYLSYVVGAAAAVNIALNFLLVPRYGMMGAAATNAVSQAVAAFLVYQVAQRLYPVPYDVRAVSRVLFAGTALVLLSGCAEPLWLRTLLCASYFPVLAAAGIVRRDTLRDLRALFTRVGPAPNKGAPRAKPSICMFVLNPVVSDPRVLREARTLRRNGHDVTIIGLHDGPRTDMVRDDLRIILLRRNVFFRFVLKVLAERTGARGDSPAPAAAGSAPDMAARLVRFIFDCGEIVQMLLTNLSMAFAGIRLNARIYHSHDLNTLIAGYAASRVRRAKLVYDFHEAYAEQFPHDASTTCWRGFYGLLERALIGKADRLITVCGSLSRWARERYGAPGATVIMNTSDHREMPRQERTAADSGTTVLYHGIYMKDRGLEQLIKAVKFLPPDVTLVMRGKGEIEPLLRSLAEREGVAARVTFAPPVRMEDLIGAAAAADIGVIPYIATSLNNRFSTPNKLFEYMMAGLAVAGSDLPELRAVIVGEGIGEVFDPEAPGDIARAIASMAADRRKLDRMKLASIDAARSKYNWEQESRKLIGIYSDLCAE